MRAILKGGRGCCRNDRCTRSAELSFECLSYFLRCKEYDITLGFPRCVSKNVIQGIMAQDSVNGAKIRWPCLKDARGLSHNPIEEVVIVAPIGTDRNSRFKPHCPNECGSGNGHPGNLVWFSALRIHGKSHEQGEIAQHHCIKSAKGVPAAPIQYMGQLRRMPFGSTRSPTYHAIADTVVDQSCGDGRVFVLEWRAGRDFTSHCCSSSSRSHSSRKL